MQSKIMLSNRHAHLTAEHITALFGAPDALTASRDLGGNLFVSAESLELRGPKGSIGNVRVLFPARNYTQVEIFRADAHVLGVKAPLRESGDLRDAAELTLVGPAGSVTVPCGIIAWRHLHIDAEEAAKNGLENGEIIQIKCGNERALIFDEVLVRYAPNGTNVIHLDFEEGNAAWVNNGDYAEIIKK